MDNEGCSGAVEVPTRTVSGKRRRLRNLIMRCPYCCYTTRRSPDSSGGTHFRRHLLTHTKERPYKCYVCLVGFTTNTNMKRHIRTLHPEVVVPPVAASSGSAPRQSTAALDCNEGAPNASSTTSDEGINCRFCNVGFSCKGKRTRHERHCSSRPNPPRVLSWSDRDNTQVKVNTCAPPPTEFVVGPADTFFVCPNCEQELANRRQLKRHLRCYCPFRDDVFGDCGIDDDVFSVDLCGDADEGSPLRKGTKRSRLIVSRRCAGVAQSFAAQQNVNSAEVLNISAAEAGLHSYGENVTFTCPYDDCMATFLSRQRWLKHVARRHPCELVPSEDCTTVRLGILAPR
ncbi:hypothetical protein, conserved [Trypanosoma brucei gambiense DAL972]|uniref:C2H2-type domain-containing protein n=1 Tax=Trypanosoma brucei gambiense (strain MHOM/CI/86/DAL972) TaxID=679716 RepID=C9ZXA5_TRYB9|nr:hypothetical protein, conserved [Trypanosoma brucei gambiense DAL972]CBH14049.1 hypothetical protein, conserved [Trypanosoma brucei gambiense DAL972]|eukprot:XP_011776320.1 hypothetical protein, conserved [Trypanosoma brucei gambiense DAL972]